MTVDMSKTTAKAEVRKALLAGKKLTPLAALREYGCMRLADIVFKLRKEGMDIETGTRTQKGKTFACYSLRGVEHQGPGRPRAET